RSKPQRGATQNRLTGDCERMPEWRPRRPKSQAANLKYWETFLGPSCRWNPDYSCSKRKLRLRYRRHTRVVRLRHPYSLCLVSYIPPVDGNFHHNSSPINGQWLVATALS